MHNLPAYEENDAGVMLGSLYVLSESDNTEVKLLLKNR